MGESRIHDRSGVSNEGGKLRIPAQFPPYSRYLAAVPKEQVRVTTWSGEPLEGERKELLRSLKTEVLKTILNLKSQLLISQDSPVQLNKKGGLNIRLDYSTRPSGETWWLRFDSNGHPQGLFYTRNNNPAEIPGCFSSSEEERRKYGFVLEKLKSFNYRDR